MYFDNDSDTNKLSFYEKLCKKAETLKENFKTQRESLRHMKESKQKFKEKYIQQQDQIKSQKEKIQKIQHTEKKKVPNLLLINFFKTIVTQL